MSTDQCKKSCFCIYILLTVYQLQNKQIVYAQTETNNVNLSAVSTDILYQHVSMSVVFLVNVLLPSASPAALYCICIQYFEHVTGHPQLLCKTTPLSLLAMSKGLCKPREVVSVERTLLLNDNWYTCDAGMLCWRLRKKVLLIDKYVFF